MEAQHKPASSGTKKMGDMVQYPGLVSDLILDWFGSVRVSVSVMCCSSGEVWFFSFSRPTELLWVTNSSSSGPGLWSVLVLVPSALLPLSLTFKHFTRAQGRHQVVKLPALLFIVHHGLPHPLLSFLPHLRAKTQSSGPQKVTGSSRLICARF